MKKLLAAAVLFAFSSAYSSELSDTSSVKWGLPFSKEGFNWKYSAGTSVFFNNALDWSSELRCGVSGVYYFIPDVLAAETGISLLEPHGKIKGSYEYKLRASWPVGAARYNVSFGQVFEGEYWNIGWKLSGSDGFESRTRMLASAGVNFFFSFNHSVSAEICREFEKISGPAVYKLYIEYNYWPDRFGEIDINRYMENR